MNFESYVDSYKSWTNIKTRWLGMRDPFLVYADEPLNTLDQLGAVETWQTASLCRYVHSFHVELGSEKSYPTVNSSVGFHSLEQLRNWKCINHRNVNITWVFSSNYLVFLFCRVRFYLYFDVPNALQHPVFWFEHGRKQLLNPLMNRSDEILSPTYFICLWLQIVIINSNPCFAQSTALW